LYILIFTILNISKPCDSMAFDDLTFPFFPFFEIKKQFGENN